MLAHLGLTVGGSSIEEATYRAHFFERAIEIQFAAMAVVGGHVSRLRKVNATKAEQAKKWRASKGSRKAHFNA